VDASGFFIAQGVIMKQSELDAVNVLLVAIGDVPVNDLEITNADVSAARVVLETARAEVLSVGWWFNYEKDFPLSPADNGTVPIPPNTLELDSTNTSDKYVQRDGKLYDAINRTFQIDEIVNVDIVFDVEWEELPWTAYQLIVAQASVDFVGGMDGDKLTIQRLSDKALKLGNMLKKSHIRNMDTNIFSSPRAIMFFGGMPGRSW